MQGKQAPAYITVQAYLAETTQVLACVQAFRVRLRTYSTTVENIGPLKPDTVLYQ